MKKIVLGLLVCLAWAGMTVSVQANPASVQIVQIQNPDHYAGVQIGDVLQRSVRIQAPAAMQVVTNSLPMKGLQRQGVELREVSADAQSRHGGQWITLTFSYQVFASSGQPVQLQLPAEQIVLSDGTATASVALPSWRFWYMAQLPDRLMNARQSVIPQMHPALLATTGYQQLLGVSMALVVLSLVVLAYRNADIRWLPMMNGAFAQACRQLKKVPGTAAGQKQAAMLLQQAFNRTFGRHLLAAELPLFLQQYPRFKRLESEIQAFFEQSNAVLYAGRTQEATLYLQQLTALARQLRHCERG